MKRRTLLTIFILTLWLAGFSVWADTSKLNSNGILHKIETIHHKGSTDKNPKTYLLHKLQKEDGTIEKRKIPLTDDLWPDIEPQLDLEPSTQQPLITWSRFDGRDYEIAFSSFDGSRWSPPQYITSNANHDRESRIIIGSSGLAHLMWKEETEGFPIYYYLSVDYSIGMAGDPDVLIPPEDNLVLPDGTTPHNSSPLEDQTLFFAFHVPIPPNRIVLWGGKDDPSPISFQEGFKLLDDDQDLSILKTEMINGRLTVIFVSEDQLYYTYRTAESWTPYRVVMLDDTLSEGKAELLIREMLGGL